MSTTTTTSENEVSVTDDHSDDEPDVPEFCPQCDLPTMTYLEEDEEVVCHACHTTTDGRLLEDYDYDGEYGNDDSATNLTTHGPPHRQPTDSREEYKHTKSPIKYGAFPKVQHVDPRVDDEKPIGPYANS